ncbi:MAG: hypothetical protein KA015_02110 [Spirochaetes bacterium]|jgi:hypothetical protein|nr:hypothetical protein [Spirochaetota bacterium]
MRGKVFRDQNKVVEESRSKNDYWKRRPSEIRGYQKAFYVNGPDGSYVRVDYNLKDKKLRLYLEDASEGGIAYYSIISKGSIEVEKNLATGRSGNLSHKFQPLASLIASLPHKEVVTLFGDCYGISAAFKDIRESVKRKKLERTREKYFVEGKRAPIFGSFSSAKSLSWIDLIDVIIAAGAGFAVYKLTGSSYQPCGVILAFLGIAAGGVDILMRKREPIFSKIILLLSSGAGLYIYGRFFD